MSCDNSHWQILLKNCPTIWGVFFEKNNLKFDFIASKSLVEKYFFLYTSNFKDVHLKKILYLYRNFPIKFDFIFHIYMVSLYLIHNFLTTYVGYPHNIPVKSNSPQILQWKWESGDFKITGILWNKQSQ